MDCGNWQERQLSHNYSLKCCNEVCKLCSKPLKFISDGTPCAVKAACTVQSGGDPAITSKDYLSLSGAKSQGMKQLMAGGGVALIGTTLVPLLSGLFG